MLHTGLAALVLTGLGAMGATALMLHTGLAVTMGAAHTGLAMTMATAHTGLLTELVGITFHIRVASSNSLLGADYTIVVGVNRSAGNRSRSGGGSNLRSRALSEYRHRSGEQEEHGFLHILYFGLC